MGKNYKVLVVTLLLAVMVTGFAWGSIKVVVNGKEHTAGSVNRRGGTFLESEDVKKIFGVTVKAGNFRSMRVDGKLIRGCPKVNGKRYINAGSLAGVLGYKLKVEGTEKLTFTRAGDATGGKVGLKVLDKKTGEPNDEGKMTYTLKVEFTNNTDSKVTLNLQNFYLEEESGTSRHVNDDNSKDDVTVEPGKTVTLQKINFTIPKDAKIKYLVFHRGRKLSDKVEIK